MSFLLMVPEAASPSGPPSSRMSLTSAPVAIAPERWVGARFRSQGSAPEEGPGSDRGAEPLQGLVGAGRRGGPRGQERPRSGGRPASVPPPGSRCGSSCHLSPSASATRVPSGGPAAPLLPQSRGKKLPVARFRNATDRNTSGRCLAETEPTGNPA